MNIISCENLAKSYGERVLFQDVSFGIDTGDKIGLIGINGTGKSTLLKTVAGLLPPDEGRRVAGRDVRIAYLPQNPEFDVDATVLTEVFRGESPQMRLLRQYELLYEQLAERPDDPEIARQSAAVNAQMDEYGAWQLESDAKVVLTQLGISNFQAKAGSLSGGQKKRLALAGALIMPVDLLILDEPTNHIDSAAVAWLEQYLARRTGALLMVTHDRYFLDRVATRIFELDSGKLYSHIGNYSRFLAGKAEREAQAEASAEARRNLYRRELAWIQRGAKARSTKQKARISRFEALAADKPAVSPEKMEIVTGASRLGRTVIELSGIGKQFDGRTIFRDFSYTVLRDDRVGIVGPNGSGKSTLLNIIAGRLDADCGGVTIGRTVKIGYFAQENAAWPDGMRVLDYVKDAGAYVTAADGTLISAAQMLENFLFGPQLMWMPVEKLSGGEKRRLELLKVLMGAPNVLLLDEPTNDLDTETLTILESYLEDFAGAVIAVSHDRYFLDKVADKIFAFEGGVLRQYPGNYSDFLVAREAIERADSGCGHEESAPPDRREKPRSQRLKFTFREEKEFAEIDGVIAGVEQELNAVEAEMNQAACDAFRLQELFARKQELSDRLDVLMNRWMYLNELAEKISGQNRQS